MVNLIFNWCVHLMLRTWGSTLNPYRRVDSKCNISLGFSTLKSYSAVFCVFGSIKYIYFFSQLDILVSPSRWISISSPVDFLVVPVEHLLFGLIPKNIWKFDIYPSESISPHWGTELGCVIFTIWFLFVFNIL